MSWEQTSKENELPTESSDSSVVHHIIEAMQLSAEDYLSENKEYVRVANTAETNQEVIEHFMKKGDSLIVSAIISQALLDDIHEAVHEVMGGKGISQLSEGHIKDISMEWFRSPEFKEKYARIINKFGIDHVKAELGIK